MAVLRKAGAARGRVTASAAPSRGADLHDRYAGGLRSALLRLTTRSDATGNSEPGEPAECRS